ncbi:VOC family protein [Rhizorhabdus sp.]|uniref:2-oxoadipate dioxygenase/decarboxylase HglS n=1 Tax=Rhizorhabdus sp. TaxID=1968843 RepID=UPI0025D53650|nr:VOC family protein [Rhizorhabdus sp.]
MGFVSSDHIRARFSAAMSEMYRAEVPQYGTLLKLVDASNAAVLARDPALAEAMGRTGDIGRLAGERHGAIRVGTPAELALMRRAFAVMGMAAVGYYDLAGAGVPVHSTAFRPVDQAALTANPFRVFTSLLRLELIDDAALRAEAQAILDARRIVTPGALALIGQAERDGGLDEAAAADFVAELLETFRWHATATVSAQTYGHLLDTHRLIADVVSFRGPHINHLTPRTLDIDAVQAAMPAHGITPKESIEGPPRRRCPILLRQTSFKALDERILFPSASGEPVPGRHTARFGEVEQRGVALTPQGRAIYDAALAAGRLDEDRFGELPDDWDSLRRGHLAYFRYSGARIAPAMLDAAIAAGDVVADPVIYEDFLPVSAAGIFQSNLGDEARGAYGAQASRAAFEQALGTAVLDEFALYEAIEARSLQTITV